MLAMFKHHVILTVEDIYMIIEMFERGDTVSTCKNVTHDIKLSHHSRDIWGQSWKIFDDE